MGQTRGASTAGHAAKYDWQVYDPQRKEKGGVRWHTVEGPFVLERKGRYYEMFSGGNWQNTTYGVSFASSDSVNTAGEWEQFSDGAKVLPILRGPCRNASSAPATTASFTARTIASCSAFITAGPKRAVCCRSDRMDFAGGRIFVTGATDTPQPAPFLPKVRDPFDATLDTSLWEHEGNWKLQGGEAVCELAETSTLTCRTPQNYLGEICFRCVKTVNGGAVKFCIAGNGANLANSWCSPICGKQRSYGPRQTKRAKKFSASRIFRRNPHIP